MNSLGKFDIHLVGIALILPLTGVSTHTCGTAGGGTFPPHDGEGSSGVNTEVLEILYLAV